MIVKVGEIRGCGVFCVGNEVKFYKNNAQESFSFEDFCFEAFLFIYMYRVIFFQLHLPKHEPAVYEECMCSCECAVLVA